MQMMQPGNKMGGEKPNTLLGRQFRTGKNSVNFKSHRATKSDHMQSAATTVKDYVDGLPEDRRKAINQLRQEIKNNLPEGFAEEMSYGMIGYVVPHSLYPGGYHCNPAVPLPFLNIASQKNFIALYHMGLYAQPELLQWFQDEYPKHSKTKPDMGKSCIRFKKPDQIPFALIGTLASKMTPGEWIEVYEKKFRK
jgi:hypothetical protein